MGAYAGATVITGGGVWTNFARCNDGDDSSFAQFPNPFVVGAGVANLGGQLLYSLEVRDFSPSLGATIQAITARTLHQTSIVYSGDTNPAHFGAQRQVQVLHQYSVNGGASYVTSASHTSTVGGDLVLAQHFDVVLVPSVTPSAFRIRLLAQITQFQTTSAFTGGTFTIDERVYALEDAIIVLPAGSMLGFM